MTAWPIRKLSEVARIYGGSTPSRDVLAYWNGEVPWLSPAELPMPGNGIAMIESTRERITDLGLNSCAATLLPAGSVVYSTRATIGKIGITRIPLATNQGFVSFVPSSEISAEFLAYALLVHTHAITQLAGSTTFKEVSRGSLREFPIPVPPVSEQSRIVEMLDEATALKQLRASADRQSERIAPAIFDEMFGDPLQNRKHWTVVPVSYFVERFQTGKSVAPSGDDGLVTRNRILKVSAVTWGTFDPNESKPVPDTYTPPPDHFVRSGDMLFSRANTAVLVGATVLVKETPSNLLLPDKIWRFVWKDPLAIETGFILSLFQHPATRRELGNRATGTGGAMKNISMEKVMTMEVIYPPPAEQKRFSIHVGELRTMEERQAASGRRLHELFDSLIHGVFEGEL